MPANAQGYVASETYEYDYHFVNGAACAGRGLVTKITHADGYYQSFGYDIYGNKSWEENELRQRTSYAYDDYKRLLSVTNPLAQTTNYTYTPTNGTSTSPYVHTTASIRTVTTPMGVVTANVYDANFRKTSTTEASGTGIAATTWFGYDNVGNATFVTDPRGGYSGNPTYTTKTDYDSRNRKWHITDPLNHVTTFNYGDAVNVTSINRPDNTTEAKTYDAMNRGKTEQDGAGRTTTFYYNYSGALSQVTDAKGQWTQFSYNGFDRKTQMTYMDGSTQTWTYDNVNNMTSRKMTNGLVYSYQFDSRNRQSRMDLSDGSDWNTFGYDAASRVSAANNWVTSVTRQYDGAGQLTLDRQYISGLGNNDVTYTYDADGKRTRLYIPGTSYDRTYSYDAMGRFEKIFNTADGMLWFQYYYDAASNETQRYSYWNNVAQVYYPDALNRMSRRDIRTPAGDISHEYYGFDAMSRITSVYRDEDGRTDSFGYDGAGQLTSANYGWQGRSVSYTLDSAGNRSQKLENGSATGYQTNNLNQYTVVANSGLVIGGDHAIHGYASTTYSARGDKLSLITYGSNQYALYYDALGRCVERRLGGVPTWYIYDGERPIYERKSDGTMAGWNEYGKGIDEILMRGDYVAVPGGQGYFFQQDHEGSVTHLMNFQGGVIESYRYDAFGSWYLTAATGSYNSRFKFTGREAAPSPFTFYEYRNRAYHPALGRFMSEDPKGFDAGDYNLFRYVGNDPINKTDPMGEDWGDVQEAVYSFFTAGGRATFDAQSKYGDTTGKFAVQEGFKATTRYNDTNAGEAVRHEVWQSELARKYGEYNARKIGDAHEKFKSKDAQDSKRDQYHNELGRENAKDSKSREDSLRAARRDWESGRAARDKNDRRVEKPAESKERTPDARTVEPKKPDDRSAPSHAIEFFRNPT